MTLKHYVNYLKPIYIDEIITFVLKDVKVYENDRYKISVGCYNQNNKLVLDGFCTVLWEDPKIKQSKCSKIER